MPGSQGPAVMSSLAALQLLAFSVLLAQEGAAGTAAATHATRTRCRCLPSDACWQRVDWAALNASVHGRLEVSVDEMAPCQQNLQGASCSAALEGSDNEFWLADRPNGFQHTGGELGDVLRGVSSFND